MLSHTRDDAIRRPLDSEGGFTLIEIMIAAVVLMVGLVSVVGISAYVSRLNAT